MTLFVSVFVNKATTASSVGFFLYLVGAMGQGQLSSGFLKYDSTFPRSIHHRIANILGFARFLYDPNMEWYYTYPPSLLPFILLAKVGFSYFDSWFVFKFKRPGVLLPFRA